MPALSERINRGYMQDNVMTSRLYHKGYTGSVLFSVEDDCLHGKILDINDIITYEGETVKDIKKAFEGAVDRYISACKNHTAYVYIDDCTVKRINPDGSYTLLKPPTAVWQELKSRNGE